jgi:hypothetical protein
MGILRYIVQGVGWEIGRSAAREGIEALDKRDDERPPSAAELKHLAREREKAETRARKAAAQAEAKRVAAIEAQLRELKKKAGH